MKLEDKAEIVISQLREDRDRLQNIIEQIRAEIEQKIVKRHGLNHTRSERDRNDAFLEVLDIIDKYKAESEDKE